MNLDFFTYFTKLFIKLARESFQSLFFIISMYKRYLLENLQVSFGTRAIWDSFKMSTVLLIHVLMLFLYFSIFGEINTCKFNKTL